MKNKWEITKYCLATLLVASTFTVSTYNIAQVTGKQKNSINCDCNSQIELALAEKINAQTDKIVSIIKECNNDTDSHPNLDISTAIEPDTSTVTGNAKFAVGETVPIPTLPTHVKLCTDYRCYNLWYTPHYRLQQAAYTDENGLRRYGEDYIVGLGKFYSESIGDRFKVTLDTGNEFTIILGDGKAPCDCDDNNMYTPCKNYSGEDCANVLEFIMDSDAMADAVYAYGSIDCLDEFKGNIVKMEYLGRDNSADWDTYETR